MALSTPPGAAGRPTDAVALADAVADSVAAPSALVQPLPSSDAFAADPRPIPVDLLTQLEAASEQPVATELNALLGAVQHGFGTESALLEPTLHSYASRAAARLGSTTDTFRVVVTAPSPDLAEARAELVARLFASAGDRVHVASGAGPHALTLVSD